MNICDWLNIWLFIWATRIMMTHSGFAGWVTKRGKVYTFQHTYEAFNPSWELPLLYHWAQRGTRQYPRWEVWLALPVVQAQEWGKSLLLYFHDLLKSCMCMCMWLEAWLMCPLCGCLRFLLSWKFMTLLALLEALMKDRDLETTSCPIFVLLMGSSMSYVCLFHSFLFLSFFCFFLLVLASYCQLSFSVIWSINSTVHGAYTLLNNFSTKLVQVRLKILILFMSMILWILLEIWRPLLKSCD